MAVLARWKFDETSGTTFADSSGNGRDMTLVGSATLGATKISSDADVNNRSAEFNADGSYARRTASDSGLANLVDNFTIGGWIRIATSLPAHSTMLLGRQYIGSPDHVPWALIYNRDNAYSNRFGFHIYNGAWRDCVFPYDGGPSGDSWRNADHFFVGTFSGGTMRLYYNGALYGITTGITPANSQSASYYTISGRKWDLSSGRYGEFGGYGRHDDLFVMDEALTARAVRELYKDMAQITSVIPSAALVPQANFQQGGWTLNNYASIVSSSRVRVADTANGNVTRAAVWHEPVTIDGYTFEWQSDISVSGSGHVGLHFSDRDPYSVATSNAFYGVGNGGFRSAAVVADVGWNDQIRVVSGTTGLDRGVVGSVGDGSMRGVITWSATLTKTATDTYTVAVKKNGSLVLTVNNVTIKDTSYVGLSGSNASGGIDGYAQNLVVTAPVPPTPTRAYTRLKRPVGLAARSRSVW